ncbi:type I-B CRISPR-associated protein Cas8b/Csh1 [Clostridium manihotivorum]|uniref:Type I-B CRISPR-associated protein Cas8b/Csh1 n=1 Tax=Clostridium manihotivorum TaxID=2320868 RepID=A0A3R5X3E0_9CLOT|nr:type I-B CRISPR-associated protein Cas8b/Csh1 [Clostridium manihotivorum]QAA33498.1 type I-B CRISPR-associated protein Cas8b/Csh1 [Clostridium manihotivorum]
MLKECLEVFKNQLEENTEKLITDSYIPSDGTYLLVEPIGDSYEIKETINIKLDKKTREVDKSNEFFQYICEADYNSKLIDMNKPIDGKKIIHSNNYLSFFIKKESLLIDPATKERKLTEERIDEYYAILSNPYLKYSKGKGKSLYETVENEIGQVDIERLEKIRAWIKENIFNLEIDITGKDYLKIFFRYPIEDYVKEGKRYLIPNIYNSNDFNVNIGKVIYGLPNDNMGLNAKKPYLENKSRKTKVPYLVDNEEVLLQKKFFDYLMNFAAVGKVNIYIGKEVKGYKNGDLPEEDFQGIFLRIKKGKEVEVHDFDSIPSYKVELPKKFNLVNVLDADLDKLGLEGYKRYSNRLKMQELVDDILFSNFLKNNYFTESKDIGTNDNSLKNNLLISRGGLFNWFHKGVDSGVAKVLERVSLSLVKNSVLKGSYMDKKACHQFNLRWSLINYFEGGENMADIIKNLKENLKNKINSKETESIESDNEYFFAIGQLVNFFLSKSKGKKKPHSLANPFINAKENKFLKEKLMALYKKYNYDIEKNGKRFNNLYGMIVSYETEAKVNQDMILAGYLHSSLIYESDKKEDNINE